MLCDFYTSQLLDSQINLIEDQLTSFKALKKYDLLLVCHHSNWKVEFIVV